MVVSLRSYLWRLQSSPENQDPQGLLKEHVVKGCCHSLHQRNAPAATATSDCDDSQLSRRSRKTDRNSRASDNRFVKLEAQRRSMTAPERVDSVDKLLTLLTRDVG